MREILFRGKRVDNGKWVYGFYIENETLSGSLIPTIILIDEKRAVRFDSEGYNVEVFVTPETVGQYTGLTDKNGTRIFEGDVIRDEDGDVMVVKWLTESAAFVLEPKPYASIYFYGTLSSRIEVIGNIHDNPELLKGSAKNE